MFAPELYFVPELREYAAKLQEAGFTVYRHAREQARYDGSPRQARYFLYSRTVEGRECFGTVQIGDFPLLGQPLEHSMPIKPSVKFGSSMFIEGREHEQTPTDSAAYAELIARPTNHNHIVGSHDNWFDTNDLARRFVPLDKIARDTSL